MTALCVPYLALADTAPTPAINKLNERMRQETRQAGSMPNMASLPKPHLPKTPLHVIYLVDTNKRGQVVKVRAGQPSANEAYNQYTYYNAIQTFIRTVDGAATAGVFKLTYDYSPQTQLIKRDVELVKKGGVNPDAPGAVEVMEHSAAAAHK